MIDHVKAALGLPFEEITQEYAPAAEPVVLRPCYVCTELTSARPSFNKPRLCARCQGHLKRWSR